MVQGLLTMELTNRVAPSGLALADVVGKVGCRFGPPLIGPSSP